MVNNTPFGLKGERTILTYPCVFVLGGSYGSLSALLKGSENALRGLFLFN